MIRPDIHPPARLTGPAFDLRIVEGRSFHFRYGEQMVDLPLVVILFMLVGMAVIIGLALFQPNKGKP